MAARCICDFPPRCDGDGLRKCQGCGAAFCICACGGETECFGCADCIAPFEVDEVPEANPEDVEEAAHG